MNERADERSKTADAELHQEQLCEAIKRLIETGTVDELAHVFDGVRDMHELAHVFDPDTEKEGGRL